MARHGHEKEISFILAMDDMMMYSVMQKLHHGVFCLSILLAFQLKAPKVCWSSHISRRELMWRLLIWTWRPLRSLGFLPSMIATTFSSTWMGWQLHPRSWGRLTYHPWMTRSETHQQIDPIWADWLAPSWVWKVTIVIYCNILTHNLVDLSFDFVN